MTGGKKLENGFTAQDVTGKRLGNRFQVEDITGEWLENGHIVEDVIEANLENGHTVEDLTGKRLESGHTIDDITGKGLENGHSVENITGKRLQSGHTIEDITGKRLENKHTVENITGKRLEIGHTIEDITGKRLENGHTVGNITKKRLENGHTVEDITGEEAERLKKDYFLFTDGAIRFHPGCWLYPKTFERFADLIYNFKARPTDIFVATFPKSGTTWMQEIVWNLVHNPDLDNPKASISLEARFPSFQSDMYLVLTGAPPPNPEGEPMKLFARLFPGMHWSEGLLIHLGAFAPDPRLNKLHIPFTFLSPEVLKISKTIYVVRDPRDVMISYYHYQRLHLLQAYRGTLEAYVDDFINGSICFGPYFEHVKQAWDRRNDSNFLFIYYEDLKTDVITEIKKVNRFLGTNRSNEQIENVAKCTSFSEMKERSKLNPPTSNDNIFFNKEVEKEQGGFFRKGKVGSWMEELSPELQKRVNEWMKKNLSQFGEDFKYKV